MAIKVYVVDDSAVVRQTLMHLLQGDPEIELMGSAPNPLIAGPAIQKNRPDVLLLDIEMPGMTGLELATQLQRAVVETGKLVIEDRKWQQLGRFVRVTLGECPEAPPPCGSNSRSLAGGSLALHGRLRAALWTKQMWEAARSGCGAPCHEMSAFLHCSPCRPTPHSPTRDSSARAAGPARLPQLMGKAPPEGYARREVAAVRPQRPS
jgi:hypothetical protein